MARHALASAAPSHTILDPTWWQAAAIRAAYTAIALAISLALQVVAGEITVTFVLSALAVVIVLSLVTSLAGLPEVTDRSVSAWLAIIVRVTKTAAQVLASALVSAQLVSDVAWAEVWQLVAGAALVTFLRTVLDYLPETDPNEITSTVTVDVVPNLAPGLGLVSGTDLADPDLQALAGALDEGDPARAALERLGVSPVLSEQQWAALEKIGGTE